MEGRKSCETALLEEGSSERDGRLRPPPSVQEKVKVCEMLPLPVFARSAEVRRKGEISKEETLKKVSKVEDRYSKETGSERRGNEAKIESSGGDMDQEAMKKRIRQLEQALKEKEEAEERRKKFLQTGKQVKTSKMNKTKTSQQRSRGSKKNCHLVRSMAKKFEGVANDSTSSSSEDTDGYDSTSDTSNMPSPSPPARHLLAKVSHPQGSESLGNHDPTEEESPKLRKTEDEGKEIRGQETRVGGAVAKDNGAGGEIASKEVDEGETLSTSVVEDSETGVKQNVEEEQQQVSNGDDQEKHYEELEGQEKHYEELEDPEKSQGGEGDGFDVNENMLGSEKEADCGEDPASVDLCEVKVESSCLINRLDQLESSFMEVENAHLESDNKESAGEKEVDVKVAAELKEAAEKEKVEMEKAEKDEAAAKKAEGYRRKLMMLAQEHNRLRQEEEERKKAEYLRDNL